MAKGAKVRVGAMADLHYTAASRNQVRPLLEQVSQGVDLLLLGGDLTDYGLVEEAQALAEDVKAAVRIPVVAVLGNYDFEAGKQAEVAAVLRDAGVTVLDGEACEVKGIGIAGGKGFAGGFGRGTLAPWGESAVKHFVQEAIDEALKLERALARLRTPRKLALLHYAPIPATVAGEPPEIFPFLGCSRLEEPLNRWGVSACFHGHAHRGFPEGKTSAGVPVYNVALPLMRREHSNGLPCRVLELLPDATSQS
jgi:Icc-related predicted phosphoesterase